MSSIKLKHSGGNSVSLNPPTSAPTSSDVAFKLPNADGSAGQVIKTDGSGALSFVAQSVAGITALNVWYLTTSFSGNADPIVNWAKYDGDYNTAGFGADMTESSGIWTFPSTGFWQIRCSAYLYNNGNASAGSVAMSAYFTIDGSNYDNSGNKRSYSNIPFSSGYWYSQNINIHYFDVTDTSTHKMKLRMEGSPADVNAGGTMVQFIRLADT
jgi:hypothetical protein